MTNRMKSRKKQECNQTVTKCHQSDSYHILPVIMTKSLKKNENTYKIPFAISNSLCRMTLSIENYANSIEIFPVFLLTISVTTSLIDSPQSTNV